MSPLNDPLAQLLELSERPAVVDVGANPIDGLPPYDVLLKAGLCTVVGFEPQPEALAKLLSIKGPFETYLPDAVGDGQQHTLRICHADGMSSLFEPDDTTQGLFNGLKDFGQVLSEMPVQTRRLDDIAEVPHIDMLKADVQGSELAVLQGGRKKLSDAVAVHLEVSFIPLYKNQPVFWEIDRELREQGFLPHAFETVKRWSVAPLLTNNDFRYPMNQLLEGDVIYFRDFLKPENLSPLQWRKLALIAAACYRSHDVAMRAIHSLVSLGALPADATTRFAQVLNKANPRMTYSVGG